MQVNVLDTETASLEGGVVDFALVRLDEGFNVVYSVESLIDPERPISPGAMGIHHITDAMVADQPTMAEFVGLHPDVFYPGMVVAAHNAQFDCRMLAGFTPQDHKRICTLRLARELWPDVQDHKLQTLRYTFGLEAGPAHRAMGDVITCVSLLRRAHTEFGLSLEQMVAQCSRTLPLTTKLSFGKHRGTAIGDLPKSYIRWMLEKMDTLDPDLRAALQPLA
jgi:exodeoxyribonuclease X